MDAQSQLLRINSKFRNSPSNSTPSNFTYSIASTSATESVTKLELISFNTIEMWVITLLKVLLWN